MKYALALLALTLAVPAHASQVTCADGREETAAQKISASIQAGVTSLLKAKGIAVKSITVQGDLVVNDDSDLNNNTVTMYGEYTIRTGEVVTTDGTKLSVDLDGDDYPNGVDVAFFEPVLKSSGFDHEGNPINGHCTLNLSVYTGYSNDAGKVAVSNEGSGKVIGAFGLSKAISLY